VNLPNRGDRLTPLHIAAAAGSANAARELLELGASGATGSINERDAYGDTPLHYAASADHVAVVDLLCQPEYGADLWAAGHDGCTPLQAAEATGRSKRVVTLFRERLKLLSFMNLQDATIQGRLSWLDQSSGKWLNDWAFCVSPGEGALVWWRGAISNARGVVNCIPLSSIRRVRYLPQAVSKLSEKSIASEAPLDITTGPRLISPDSVSDELRRVYATSRIPPSRAASESLGVSEKPRRKAGAGSFFGRTIRAIQEQLLAPRGTMAFKMSTGGGVLANCFDVTVVSGRILPLMAEDPRRARQWVTSLRRVAGQFIVAYWLQGLFRRMQAQNKLLRRKRLAAMVPQVLRASHLMPRCMVVLRRVHKGSGGSRYQDELDEDVRPERLAEMRSSAMGLLPSVKRSGNVDVATVAAPAADIDRRIDRTSTKKAPKKSSSSKYGWERRLMVLTNNALVLFDDNDSGWKTAGSLLRVLVQQAVHGLAKEVVGQQMLSLGRLALEPGVHSIYPLSCMTRWRQDGGLLTAHFARYLAPGNERRALEDARTARSLAESQLSSSSETFTRTGLNIAAHAAAERALRRRLVGEDKLVAQVLPELAGYLPVLLNTSPHETLGGFLQQVSEEIEESESWANDYKEMRRACRLLDVEVPPALRDPPRTDRDESHEMTDQELEEEEAREVAGMELSSQLAEAAEARKWLIAFQQRSFALNIASIQIQSVVRGWQARLRAQRLQEDNVTDPPPPPRKEDARHELEAAAVSDSRGDLEEAKKEDSMSGAESEVSVEPVPSIVNPSKAEDVVELVRTWLVGGSLARESDGYDTVAIPSESEGSSSAAAASKPEEGGIDVSRARAARLSAILQMLVRSVDNASRLPYEREHLSEVSEAMQAIQKDVPEDLRNRVLRLDSSDAVHQLKPDQELHNLSALLQQASLRAAALAGISADQALAKWSLRLSGSKPRSVMAEAAAAAAVSASPAPASRPSVANWRTRKSLAASSPQSSTWSPKSSSTVSPKVPKSPTLRANNERRLPSLASPQVAMTAVSVNALASGPRDDSESEASSDDDAINTRESNAFVVKSSDASETGAALPQTNSLSAMLDWEQLGDSDDEDGKPRWRHRVTGEVTDVAPWKSTLSQISRPRSTRLGTKTMVRTTQEGAPAPRSKWASRSRGAK
jgi:hypothetical protein